MTISYQLDISRASLLSLVRLLFRWKASIWKNVFKEFIIWTTMYFTIAFCYRAPFILTDDQRIIFEDVAHYLNEQLSLIPLTFILGFYVSIIVQRWTDMFTNMGYIESEALLINNYIRGDDEETILQRRAMVRYMCLAQVLVYRDISVRVRRRFPTYDSIIQAGFMLEHERIKLESIKLDYDKYWVPINWSYTHMFNARRANKITSDVMTNKLCDEMKVFRSNLQMLCNYDWVPLPLAYPQVIMLAVYFYFAVCLVSRQFVLSDRSLVGKSDIDLVVPMMTMVQFVFYVGWMKAAEVLLNPMGDDDDDFEADFLLDKNLATCLSIVENHDVTPTVTEDMFYSKGQVEPIYSEATVAQQNHPLVGSATHAKMSSTSINGEEVEMVPKRSLSIDTHTHFSARNLSRRISHLFTSPSLSLRSSNTPRMQPLDERRHRYMMSSHGTVEVLHDTSHGKTLSSCLSSPTPSPFNSMANLDSPVSTVPDPEHSVFHLNTPTERSLDPCSSHSQHHVHFRKANSVDNVGKSQPEHRFTSTTSHHTFINRHC